MQKMYLCLAGRMNFIKLMMVIVVMGIGGKGISQVAGDFQPKNATGNWSDFNAWNRHNGAGFVAATIGQIPTSISDIYFVGTRNIFVDITTAVCNNIRLSTAGITERISLNPGGILSIYGSLLQISNANAPFPSNGLGAKIIFTGSANQTITNSGAATNLGNIEVNKSGGIFTLPGVSTKYDVFTLTSGDVVVASGADLLGLSGSSTVNVNGGTWTQILGANRINGGASGIGIALSINAGTMTLATTSMGIAGFNFSSINITNGGTLNMISSTGNFNVTNAFSIDATSTVNSSYVTTPSATTNIFLGTFNYNAAASQNIINTSYGNLGLLVSGTKNPSATLNVSGNLTIGGAAILPLTSTVGVNIGGNWISDGEGGLTESTSTVDFNGAGAQIINTTGGENFFLVRKSGIGTLTLNSNVSATGGPGSGLNISAGVVDAGTNTLSGAGTSTLTMLGGTLKLAKLATILPEFTGTYALSAGTIELNGAIGSQILRSGIISYRNLTFSGSSTTTLSTSTSTSVIGNIYITGNAIFDATNYTFGDASTNLIMDAGRYRVSGIGTKPDIDGTYSLTGGIVEFYNSGTVSNETVKGISSVSNPINFHQIEITGNKVGQSVSNVTLRNGGGFTVKPTGVYEINDDAIVGPTGTQTVTIETGGTFKTGDVDGFAGGTGATATSVRSDIENVVLQSGSTIEYSKATGAGQIITNTGVTNPSSGNYYNLSFSGSGIKTAPSTDLTILGDFSRQGAHTFNANTSRVLFAGTTVQRYFVTAVGTTPIEFYNLTNANAINLTIDSTIGIVNEFKLNPSCKLTLGIGDINLRSTATRTAYVADLGTVNVPTIAYSAGGRFNIERYVPQVKAWRLLATPVDITTSPSIREMWQENGIAITGFGTQISGPQFPAETSLDYFTQRGSLKWFDPSIQNYREIANTNTAKARTEGYYVFVRGDRNEGLVGSGTNTVIRNKGRLLTGTQPAVPIPANLFISWGNPYASSIDFKSLNKTNIVDGFITWNPSGVLFSQYGVGTYETYVKQDPLDPMSNYVKVPGGDIRNNIFSGQAVFLQNNSLTVAGSVIAEEDDKVVGIDLNVSRGGITEERTGVATPTLEINLFAKTSNDSSFLADGLMINFNDLYSNNVDNFDSKKIKNGSENVSIKHTSGLLVVERRATLQANDTIFLSLTNTRIAPYRFEIDPSVLGNLPLNAFLKDKFLGTETPVNLTDVTNVPFSITSDAASKVADRFMIVFKPRAIAASLPFSFTNITAEKNADKTNSIKWGVANQIGISGYSIERSHSPTGFTAIGNIAIIAIIPGSTNTSFTDATPLVSDNYYRVKATSVNGQVIYSDVVKISKIKEAKLVSIAPNPIEDNTVRIQISNQRLGKYAVQIINSLGQPIYSSNFTLGTSFETISVSLPKNTAKGQYQLILIDAALHKTVKQLNIQ